MVSVIVPCYNSEIWLPNCINSVLEQSYYNWELILINDGSSDSTLDLCKTYSNLDTRIKFVDQTNQGVVVARYNGFLASSGKIILFLDSDDKFKPQAFELVARVMDSNNYDLLRFGFDYCDHNWNSLRRNFPDISGTVNQRKLMLELEDPLKNYSSPSIWDKAYTRNLAEKVFSLTKDIRIRHSEDMLFSLTALILSQNTLFIQNSLYLYLQRPGSMIHSLNRTSISDKELYIKSLKKLTNELPKGFRKRMDDLVNKESNEAIVYILANASLYSKNYIYLCQLISSLRKSFIYQEHVFGKSWRLKYIFRDLLFYIPFIFSFLLLTRAFVLKKILNN
ncbi:glycosyltransferase family 2 protein [Algoriphagus boritolerans]|nr:glycosyltransferase family 2 protein [Algoriphagus boritolerans]